MNAAAHVLILDDDEGILRLARKTLERHGYHVTTASSVADAREKVASEAPELLVLDYRLNAAETGLDFFRSLRQHGSPVPAILVTGFTDESKMIEALRAGIADVVPKTGDYLGYLPEAVHRALNQARLQKQSAETERLREREEHYRMLAEAVPQLVWTALPDGRADFLSKQWVEYTGISESEQLGTGWLNLIHPDDRTRAADAWARAVAGNLPYDVEYRIRRHDGAYRWFKARGVKVLGADGETQKWFGTSTDIQDQKEAILERERLLQAEHRARREAEEANQAKDRFLAMLSHELRTPLTPVLAAARMLEQSPELPPALAEDVRIVRRNVELEARLIDDLLDLARVANGKLQLSLETVELNGAIDAVLAMFRSEIQAKALQVEVRAEAAQRFVRADYARLQQMLWNLIKNAAKFTPERGRITVRTSDMPPGGAGRVRIEVQDTGIGIDPEHIRRLFTAFEQGSNAVTKKFGGLGLGLAITKALVELHRGKVWAASEGKGKGATFTLELPTVNAPAESTDQNVLPGAGARRGLNILLVEDHVDTAAVMQRLLRGMGHQVELATTVAAALEKWNASAFDVLISDVGLPDATGLDLIQKVRQRGCTSPAIALTGFGMEEDVQRCLGAGFTAHLTKPVNFVRLEQMLQEIAARR